uniref:Tub domain-containing protein n=1 Tax=Schistocephalus solidus TaxID=70667 RepID=A0A183TA19_SCHSO
LSTQERVNELFEQKRVPSPKFCGFVYCYAPFLTICSSGSNGKLKKRVPSPKFCGFVYCYAPFLTICSSGSNVKLKVRQRIDYKTIKNVYPCEVDANVLFIVTRTERAKTQLRVFRLPSDAKATQLRYIIDQLQLSPIYNSEMPEKINRKSHSTTVSGYSSLGTETDPRKYSTPIVSGRTKGNVYNRPVDAVTNYYESEDQFQLPRLHQYSPRNMPKSSGKSRTTQTVTRPLENELDFDEIQIYRPASGAPRYDIYSKGSSGNLSGRQRPQSRMQRHRLKPSTSSSDWPEDEDEDSGFYAASRYRSDNCYSRRSRFPESRQAYPRSTSVPPRRYRVLAD